MKAKDAFQYVQGIRAYPFSTNAKITGVMISSRYNWTKLSCAWPSNKVIASDTGLSISAVVRAKKELVEAGFLEIKRQFNNSCKYTPVLPQNIGDILNAYTSSLQAETSSPDDDLKDNLKEKRKDKLQESDSNESSLSSISNIHQEDIEHSFEVLNEGISPAAADEMLSWR